MKMIHFLGRSWVMVLALACAEPYAVYAQEASPSANNSSPIQATPDFEERTETLMNMVKARLDQASRGDNLSVSQKQARVLQEALVLLGQFEFYVATFGIHDTYTTVQELNKFRPIIAGHLGKHLSEDQ